jgi:hypothetical protein
MQVEKSQGALELRASPQQRSEGGCHASQSKHSCECACSQLQRQCSPADKPTQRRACTRAASWAARSSASAMRSAALSASRVFRPAGAAPGWASAAAAPSGPRRAATSYAAACGSKPRYVCLWRPLPSPAMTPRPALTCPLLSRALRPDADLQMNHVPRQLQPVVPSNSHPGQPASAAVPHLRIRLKQQPRRTSASASNSSSAAPPHRPRTWTPGGAQQDCLHLCISHKH